MKHVALHLGVAGMDDREALLDLERRCQSHPWTAAHFREELSRRGDARVLVLRSPDGVIAAYCVIGLVADELQVQNLGVAPEHRRRGLGRWLLAFALGHGARRGATKALLEVRQGNRAALALYGALGFEPLFVRRGYYQDPPEDAVVLQKSPLQSPTKDS